MKTHPETGRPRNLLAPFPQGVAIRQPGRLGGAARDEDKEMSEKKTRILIIDDDPEIVSYLTDIFQDAGYETLSAGNGVEGIEVAQTRKPDLITLDMDMPGRGGTLFYVKMRQEPYLAEIPVVVISGVGPRPPALNKSVPVIQKPITPEVVLETVKKMLAK